jgi:5'-3' exonuclease
MCILSGCDYLAPLGGIGLKTLHKYFLKHKTIDRVFYALRREANKLISKEYETEFLKAELTFQHQRVYCPIEKKIVCLNPLPVDIRTTLELETEETFENLEFLGPELEAELARGIAESKLNPITHQPFITTEEAKENKEIVVKAAPMKLNNFLLNNSMAQDANRLTMKRASFSTQSESIQNGIRSRFLNTPKYATTRKATSATAAKTSGGGKQFSILNFCVPKSSFNPDISEDK